MKWRSLATEASAIVACYLMLTLQTASATTVSIYSSSTPGSPMASVTYDPYGMVDMEVSVTSPLSSPGLEVVVENSSSGVLVDKVIVYRCRGMDPVSCVSSAQAEESDGNARMDFEWAAVASQTGSYPQEANVLIMVRANDAGRIFWTGRWTGVTRSSETEFSVEGSPLDAVSIYMDNIGQVNAVREFITNNHMIPFRPGWIARIAFGSATTLHELSFSQPGDVSGQSVPGSELSGVSEDYVMVLPDSGGYIRYPLAVFSSPEFVCGDSQCESMLGESTSSCCLDCGCGSGYYCDALWGCRQESGIVLEVPDALELGVSNCHESHVLSVPVEVSNPPSGMGVVSAWYALMGSQYETTCTAGSAGVYVCPVVVPAMPDCTEGVFSMGPNSIGMEISFMDGAADRTMEITSPMPYVTIGSFTCGDHVCDTGMGEDSDACCYDCGCPSGYCDYAGGSPINAGCMQDPGTVNVHAASIEPRHFQGFSVSGETVEMNVMVSDAPGSLVLTADSCSMGCTRDGEECAASCSVACSGGSVSGGTYNSTCTLRVSISGYDEGSDYRLSPTINFTMQYNNGIGTVSREVQKALGQLSVGSQWCGDRDCSGDENQENCCYDCGCGEGQYCDTASLGGPTEGDGCMPDSGAGFILDSIGSLSLEDSTRSHVIPIEGHINGLPSGVSISGDCSITNDPLGCTVACRVSGVGGEGATVSCEIQLPPIDYVTAGQPYYDEASRTLSLYPNSYAITVSYNDGHEKAEQVYEGALGTIGVSVTSHCGEGGCEEFLGESPSNCCRDCGCLGETMFCYTGASPSGECVDNSSILLEIAGFGPDPVGCTIGNIGGKCVFASAVEATVMVINSPEGASLEGVFFSLDGVAVDAECVEGAGHGNFTCAFVPESLAGTEGSDNMTVGVGMSLVYDINGATVVQELSASRSTEVVRKKSDALISCEGELARLDEQIRKLGENGNSYDSYTAMFMVMGLVMLAAFGACIYCACFGCSLGTGGEGGLTTEEVGSMETGPGSASGGMIAAPAEGPSAGPGGPSLSLSGEGALSLTPCAVICMPLVIMAMQMLMMANTLGGSSQETSMQVSSLEMQKETKRDMCSSESYGQLSGSLDGLSALAVLY